MDEPSRPRADDDALREAEILRYWRTIELFTPQAVPAVNGWNSERNTRQPVITVRSDCRLPWELPPVPCRSGYTWRHTLYLGVYPIGAVYDVLRTVFGPAEDSYDARQPGMSALAAVQVSERGQVLWDTEVLSSCAWATGRALRPGPRQPGWLEGLESAQERLADLVHQVVCSELNLEAHGHQHTPGDPVGNILTVATLSSLRTAIASCLGVQSAFACSEIRIASRRVKTSADPAESSDFLNSFIMDDLKRVAEHVAVRDAGPALHAYLSDVGESCLAPRVDVHDPANRSFTYQAVEPMRIPLGRWPADPEHSLALGQQLAVNTIIGSLSNSAGIFAVNGPPGTGKTTMLRDLIAALIVERAGRLAALDHPRAAFVGEANWKVDQYRRRVMRWAPQFSGFEIVIASSNNGAVQNVTDEIPAEAAIAAPWRGHTDHYTEIASALLAVDDDPSADRGLDGAPPRAAWGLITGRLGKKSNRVKFADTLWFDERADSSAPRLGMLSILKELERTTPPRWDAAVAEFIRCRSRVDRALRERARVKSDLAELAEAAQAEGRYWRDVQRAEGEARAHEQTAQLLDTELTAAQRNCADATARRREHRSAKPGFLQWLTPDGRGHHRAWASKDAELNNQCRSVDQNADALFAKQATALADAKAAMRAATVSRQALDHVTARADALARDVNIARMRWGRAVPDAQWWTAADDTRRELAAPWLDVECCRIRSDLFMAALQLHRAFAAQVPRELRQSLHGAIDILKGDAPADLAPDAAQAAWRALFFFVPVVSTTFASFDRVFAHLGREALGWLFIDEAGQATPQNAVGAIWRSRRAVVVGDPLQLEPVLTIPFRAQEAIRNDHRVAECWLPAGTSVQRLADQLTPVGTTMPSDESGIWVGCPLRVHRRCDEPMFGITNAVAYHGRMIAAPQDRQPLDLHPTAWIDVAGPSADGHWIREEHDVLLGLLDRLVERNQDLHEVFVISPFRDVAGRLMTLPDRYGERLRSGTIHTAQGKEADIVFLVLGGDPAKTGARQWAARPNLINVAVSRARRRLYVVGNYELWTQERNLAVVARPPMVRVSAADAVLIP